jgi:hypothetical protein
MEHGSGQEKENLEASKKKLLQGKEKERVQNPGNDRDEKDVVNVLLPDRKVVRKQVKSIVIRILWHKEKIGHEFCFFLELNKKEK